jgi:hypothetical protein
MRLISIAVIAFLMVGLTACGGDEVSWNTQETQRAIAIQNSEYNAKAFRQKNAKYSGFNIVGRGDSTISADCANGDGWASVDFVSEQGQKVKVKCSTASATIGCFIKSDFDTKSYASQEGSCNRDLPVPMPKIVK